MILFYNVCITPDITTYRLSYNRGLLPHFDKISILKYSIASLSVIPWDKAYINIELSKYFKIFESDIQKFVEEEFANIDFSFSNKRIKDQKDWQNFATKIMEDHEKSSIFFCGNHDHIFMSPNLEVYINVENLLANTDDSTNIAIFSHRNFFHVDSAVINKNFAIVDHSVYDAMVCSKVDAFYAFWHSFDGNSKFMPRSDWPGSSMQNIVWKNHSSHKIFCEHFDGSGYWGGYPINNDPPLVIPKGFFEHDIKIQFGGAKRQNYFHIDPSSDEHACVYENGIDAYWTLNDIPLFWKKRISNINIDIDKNIEIYESNALLKNIYAIHPYIFNSRIDYNVKIKTISKYNNILFDSQNFIDKIKSKLK